MGRLALLGGKPNIENVPDELFKWPIITEEDEAAALKVIRDNTYSGTKIAEEFSAEFAEWQGVKYALAYNTGTMSLAACMFAVDLRKGDEIICTTKTYWASIAQANIFGAKAVFCNVDDNLSMDVTDLERCITPKTKAIMVVHYCAYPCDMDAIMAIAKKHDLFVIEDVSHAQGGKYKGKKLGTFGHVAGISMMSGKSFAAGELGMFVTNERKFYERALAYGHYERFDANHVMESEDLKRFYIMPLGGVKGRANQLCCALARVQLKYYDRRCEEINKAMNYFWDLLEGLPGIRPIRVDESTGSTMAGWYCAQGFYVPEELHGLSARRFCAAIRAENGGNCGPGANYCLHTHPYFTEYAECPSEVDFEHLQTSVDKKCFSVPWFKHYDKEWIERYAAGFRKVIENHEQLLEGDSHEGIDGMWMGMGNKIK